MKSELYILGNDKYKENEQNENGEIITYKISSISKNQFKELSKNKNNNIKRVEDENLIQNYKPIILLKNKGHNRFSSKNKLYKNGNCLTNDDEKNHNFISIINITNNAPMQEKLVNNIDEEKICNIDILDNENVDDLKIKTMKIKSNILNNINENNNFDINNNDYFLESENKENNYSLINNIPKNNQIKNNSKNSKNENGYEIDLNQIIKKNQEINYINENSLKNKNLSLHLTNADDTNYIHKKIYDSNLTEVNQIFSNENKSMSPLKNKQNKIKFKNDFFKNLNSNTLKITKTKEVNIKDIKSNKINILKIKKLSKTINSNDSTNQITKLFSTSRDKITTLKKKIKIK